jgi:hypothetical protein
MSNGFGARYLTPMDLEYFYTGQPGHPFTLHAELLDMLEFQKASGALETATTGVFNRIYGALLWAQMNQEANAFGMLPKTTWVRSGWRVKTAFGVTDFKNTGISETGNLPTSSIPDIATVSAVPRIHVRVFDVTDVVEALAQVSSDDVWGAAHQVRAEVGVEFAKLINQALLAKVYDPATRNNVVETIDRIVSNDGEYSGGQEGWEDVYGIDRTTASWANAYVDSSSTLRDLTDFLIRNLLMNTRARGANTNVLLTGYDTYAVIQGIYLTFARQGNPMTVDRAQFGVNGITTAEGSNMGIQIAKLYDIPLVQSVDVAKGTGSGEISYLYALDTSDPEGYGFPRLGISVLRPVEYFESRDYVVLNKFVIRGVYRFVGETVARFLFGQGKVRDIRT